MVGWSGSCASTDWPSGIALGSIVGLGAGNVAIGIVAGIPLGVILVNLR